MYEAIEIFEENNPLNLEDILKSCIYNYCIKNKSEKTHRMIESTNDNLHNMKGEFNALQVQ